MSIYQMNAQQIYEAYTEDIEPSMLITEGRDAIAQRLMAEEQMPEKAAFYAADQILAFAERAEEGEPFEPGPNMTSGEYQ